eukprot:g3164.t1
MICPRAATRAKTMRTGRSSVQSYVANAVYDSLRTRRIDLSSVRCSVVPPLVFNAVSLQTGTLEELRLRASDLRCLPGGRTLSLLWCLRALDVSHNKLEKLPDAIGCLARLERLDITNNCLQALPQSLTKLTRLREISAAGNRVCRLPKTIGRLKSLRRICFEDNSIANIPGSFATLRYLETLNVARNQLPSLAVAPIALRPPEDADGRWEEALDEMTGDIVYYNRTTRRCQRRRPKNFESPNRSNANVIALSGGQDADVTTKIRVPILDLSKVVGNVIRDSDEDEDEPFGPSAHGSTQHERQKHLASKEMSVWEVTRRKDGGDTYVNRVTLERIPNAMPRDIDRLGRLGRLKTLKINGNDIATVPTSVGECVALEVLDVSMNCIRSFPDSLLALRRLKILRASHNRIETLPSDIGKLVSLEILVLGGNAIRAVPSSIGNLESCLRQLNLGGNMLTELPLEMKRLTSLKHVVIDGNPLPKDLLELIRSKGVSGLLWHCRHVELKGRHGVPPKVERTSMGVAGSVTMPKPLVAKELRVTLNQAKSTGRLTLSWMNFSEVPSAVLSLHQLEELRIIGNPLVRLPDSIGDLSALRILVLNSDALEILPDSIGKLSSLTELSLEDNKLIALPDSVSRLSNLRKLSVCNNCLVDLPAKLGDIEKLESLNLRINKLSRFPASLSNLGELELLDAGHNLLNTLPVDMWGLSSLRRLNLNRNEISEIPHTLGDLRSLRVLKLAHNRIDEIPDEICGSQWLRKKLRVLWLHSNKIQRLPRHFHLLKGLRTIRMDLNPLRSPPPGIMRAGIKQIAKYSQIRRRRIRSLFRLFRAIEVKFDTGVLEPRASNVLKSGTGHLTDQDLDKIDRLVDSYVNAEFYKLKEISDMSIVSFFKSTSRERDLAHYAKVVDAFYVFVDLVRKYDLVPASLFTNHIKMSWGEKIDDVEEPPRDETPHKSTDVKEETGEGEDEPIVSATVNTAIRQRRLERKCFGIVLSSPQVMGPDENSTADSLNAVFRKRKIKLDKTRKEPYQFTFTRAEVETALENYRGVYGRLSAPRLAMRFRRCSCTPRDLVRLCHVPLEHVNSSDEEEAKAHEMRLTMRQTIIRETLHMGGANEDDGEDGTPAGDEAVFDVDGEGSSGSESTETREKREAEEREFELQRERMMKAELQADRRRKTVARFVSKALDTVLLVPKGNVEEDLKNALKEDELAAAKKKEEAIDAENGDEVDDAAEEYEYVSDDDDDSSVISSTTTSSGEEADASSAENTDEEADAASVVEEEETVEVPKEKPLSFRERMLIKKVLRHRDRRLPHKNCVRVCVVAVKIRFTPEEAEAKRDEEEQIRKELHAATDALEIWLRSKEGRSQLHESIKYHKRLARSQLRDTQRELGEAKRNTRRTHAELMRIMERKYLYDDGLSFQRHRFSSDLEAKMTVDVATREYDHVQSVENNLVKEIQQIEARMKRPHHMWSEECRDMIRKKIRRRTRKSIIRANRHEAAELNLRRPWDGSDGILFTKWKQQYFRVREFNRAALAADDGDYDDDDDYSDASAAVDGNEDVAPNGEDDNAEDGGEDAEYESSSDGDFSSSASEILSDETIDKHMDEDGEQVYYFDTDNEAEIFVAKRLRKSGR